jgi:hypothetical protein
MTKADEILKMLQSRMAEARLRRDDPDMQRPVTSFSTFEQDLAYRKGAFDELDLVIELATRIINGISIE